MLSVSASIMIVMGLLALAFSLRPDARFSTDEPKRLRVYCAASVVKPIAEIIAEFNQQHGTQIEIARSGGSGELIGQTTTEMETSIKHGADLLVSADATFLKIALDKGVFFESQSIARQHPVIATQADSNVSVDSIEELLNKPTLKFGIASEHAAIGKLIRQVATSKNLLEPLEKQKKTETENVMTLAQALYTGSLDAAILWDTTVLQINREAGKKVLQSRSVVDNGSSLGDIAVGITSSSENNQLAKRVYQHIVDSADSKRVFESFGFEFRGPSVRSMR